MSKNKMKRIVMIIGSAITMIICLIATLLLSKNGHLEHNYGSYIVWFYLGSTFLWILVSNYMINQRYKQNV
jgi:hypothetical protein